MFIAMVLSSTNTHHERRTSVECVYKSSEYSLPSDIQEQVWINDQWKLSYLFMNNDSWSEIRMYDCQSWDIVASFSSRPDHTTVVKDILRDPNDFVVRYRQGLIVREEEEVL